MYWKRFSRVIAALVALLLVVAGCAGGEDSAQIQRSDRDTSESTLEEPLEATPQPQATPMMEPQGPQGAQGQEAADGSVKAQASLPAQDRIIVHTAYLSLVTDDVALAIGRVGDVAGRLGGWVVNSERSSRHSGSIAVRVPATSLDEALRLIGEMAEVEARSITSQDVTDEYVDSQSRLVQHASHGATASVLP